MKIKKMLILIFLLFISCSRGYSGRYEKEFKQLEESWKNYDKRTYYNIMYDIITKSDSIEGRKALLYYFFKFKYHHDTYLYKIQGVVEKYGFYEDFEVLDRFYRRYLERYDREAVRQDSSLLSVHQAYVQFLSVCNYEKIKPLYLKELSETIRQGDYTYAFNSYLLPEHWEEAADTLMKYYWMVKDEDTREKINKAILRLKKIDAVKHFISVINREKIPVILIMMSDIYLSNLKYQRLTLYDYLKLKIKRRDLKKYFQIPVRSNN